MLFVVKVKGFAAAKISALHAEIDRINNQGEEILAKDPEVQDLLRKLRELARSKAARKMREWMASGCPESVDRATSVDEWLFKDKGLLADLRAGKFNPEVIAEVVNERMTEKRYIAIRRSTLSSYGDTYDIELALKHPAVLVHSMFNARMPGENEFGASGSTFDGNPSADDNMRYRRWFRVSPRILYVGLFQVLGLTDDTPIDPQSGLTRLAEPADPE
jgi:hypothetical protein